MLASAELRARAVAAGFAAVGFARATPIDPAALDGWLAEGHAADMDWMGARRAMRLDVSVLLPGAQTVIALGVPIPSGEDGPVARYARGRDYHSILRDRLRRLRKPLEAEHPTLGTYGSVDSNPVMEKVWAERAGLGFLGKHGLIIHPRWGSQLLLAALILDEEVNAYDAPIARQCGSCTLCQVACPTGAFPRPGVVDARRCLSYQTIENAGPIPEAMRAGFKFTVFGCDLCQTCCPWNRKRAPADPAFAPRPLAALTTAEFAALTPERYAALIPGSALARAGLSGLRRNAVLALGAQGDAGALPFLQGLEADPDPLVAEAARWAIDALERSSGAAPLPR
jgi:epoxyqueuosine reductase